MHMHNYSVYNNSYSNSILVLELCWSKLSQVFVMEYETAAVVIETYFFPIV